MQEQEQSEQRRAELSGAFEMKSASGSDHIKADVRRKNK